MALFRRNKSDDSASVPEEVTSYYQAEKRDRAWMAWLLALLSLAVTALVVMGLFFGGRWVYRKLRPSSDSGSPVATTQPSESPAPKKDDTANKPAASNPTTGTAPSNGNVNAPTTPTPAPAATTPAPTTTTPPQNNQNGLPNTGPGDTIAIFLAISVFAYVVHRYLLGPSEQ